MREVVIVAAAATIGNLLIGWDSSTIAGGCSTTFSSFSSYFVSILCLDIYYC